MSKGGAETSKALPNRANSVDLVEKQPKVAPKLLVLRPVESQGVCCPHLAD
jgi:hypothetical protein